MSLGLPSFPLQLHRGTPKSQADVQFLRVPQLPLFTLEGSSSERNWRNQEDSLFFTLLTGMKVQTKFRNKFLATVRREVPCENDIFAINTLTSWHHDTAGVIKLQWQQWFCNRSAAIRNGAESVIGSHSLIAWGCHWKSKHISDACYSPHLPPQIYSHFLI